jgi:hypothetical protein
MGKGSSRRGALGEAVDAFLDRETWEVRLPREVLSTDGSERGIPTGEKRACRRGCTADEIAIRWQDGEITWVCRKMLESRDDGIDQII